MFLLLQKRPHAFDLSTSVPKPQSRQLVGGNLEATTFRPPSIFSRQFVNQEPIVLHRRSDHAALTQDHRNQNQQNLIVQPFLQPQQQIIQQQQLIPINHPYNQHAQQSQQQIINQQFYNQQLLRQQLLNQQLAQRRIHTNTYNVQTQPVPYTPFSHSPSHQQYQEQLAYSRLQQQRRYLEEQQLKQQLSRPHNRFDIANQHHYTHLG